MIIYIGKKCFYKLKDFRNRKIINIRNQNFSEFNRYIKFSKFSIVNGIFSDNINEKYDFFITGSDQVWNLYDSGRSEVDFLTFASSEKKISFSASMGVEKLPDNVIDQYKSFLKDFKSISVREESAKEIIQTLTKRKDIEVLVDPTMLLTVKDWEKVSQKPNITYPPRYILTYFLGGMNKREEIIKRIAKKHSCEIIDIYNKNSNFYACGPQHFLYLEKNAYIICTDSFHSAVFAFLFNKPFIVFDRENTKMNMNSRIESFLSKFGLQQNRFGSKKYLDEYLHWDYSEGYQILEKEREKAKQFIDNALS